MSDPDPVPQERRSILGNLPNTRPQRASARRTAARGAAGARASTAKPKPPPKPNKPGTEPKPPKSAAKRRGPATGRRPATPTQPTAPRQGFESDGDLASGMAVEPPSSTEIVASVVELLGDLAQSSLSGGGRVVKDALTRLLRI